MKYMLVLLALQLSSVCEKRRWRCIERCNEDHTIGSMSHLDCKTRCYEDFLDCRKEENDGMDR
jgi:hypothetical protein